MNPLHKNITLVAVEFNNYELTRRALELTLDKVDVKEVVVVSDQDILPGSTWVKCKPTKNFPEYSEMLLKWLWPLIDTSHALYIQADSMCWDPNKWRDDFLDYDYIGAPWPWEPEGRNVGNGGYSFRSKKLLDALRDPAVRLTAQNNWVAEDQVIAIDNRVYLENKYGIKYAPTSVARDFAYELGDPVPSAWGFHGLWNVIANVSDADLEFYMERLSWKGRNVYLWHHCLAALATRGAIPHLETALAQFREHGMEHRDNLVSWFSGENFPNKDLLIAQLLK